MQRFGLFSGVVCSVDMCVGVLFKVVVGAFPIVAALVDRLGVVCTCLGDMNLCVVEVLSGFHRDEMVALSLMESIGGLE